MTQSVGRFEVRGEIARGGMGVVYHAFDPQTQRDVALKVLLTERMSQGSEALVRFEKEAMALGKLNHPNIIRIHSVALHNGYPFFVQDLVHGRSLEQRLSREGPVPEREAAELMAKVADAIQSAHDEGILHRDLKPSNILIGPTGNPVVIDFGLAKDLSLSVSQGLSKTGLGLGTPGYWSPEQACGEVRRMGPRTDVYSLGATLYALLTGSPPIPTDNLAGNAILTVAQAPKSPTQLRPGLDRKLEAIVLKCLQKEPDDRYQSARALCEDLQHFLGGDPVHAFEASARRRLILLAVVPALLLVIGGVLFATQGLRDEPPGSAGQQPIPTAPSVLIESPAPGQETFTSRVALTGRVESQAEWVEIRISGGPPKRIEPGRFTLPITLREEGANTLVVKVTDSADQTVEVEHTVVLRRVPGWFSRLKPGERPWPLPSGLRIGKNAGEYVNVKDESVLVYVPPGSFLMGNPGKGSSSRGVGVQIVWNDRPAHRVTLSGYFIGKYEVTWAKYREFARARPAHALRADAHVVSLGGKTRRAADSHPVFGVTWEQARVYCEWAGVRLPTEAEWEYAARGPREDNFYPWGAEAPRPGYANLYGNRDGEAFLSAGGQFSRDVSPFGCYDMCGNVSEWVWDFFDPYSSDPARDPRGPKTSTRRWNGLRGWGELRRGDGPFKVIRGGAWHTWDGQVPKFDFYSESSYYYQVTRRYAGHPRTAESRVIGFRVCLGLAPGREGSRD